LTEHIIAIGDVHGCSAALAALVRVIDPTALDTLVFLGDYIGWLKFGGTEALASYGYKGGRKAWFAVIWREG
jgi:hypothetical protein